MPRSPAETQSSRISDTLQLLRRMQDLRSKRCAQLRQILCLSPPHNYRTCKNGECCYTCNDGFRDCDYNGCKTNVECNPLNCGRCGKRCQCLHTAIATCSEYGKCGFKCKPSFQLCNSNCINVTNDVHNCGKCGVICPSICCQCHYHVLKQKV